MIVGKAEQLDGTERVAPLTRKGFDIEEGQRVVVVGKLSVIHHTPAFGDGEPVAGWVEIRLEAGN
jgi:hypothetical protein